jgi:hypothetical protein
MRFRIHPSPFPQTLIPTAPDLACVEFWSDSEGGTTVAVIGGRRVVVESGNLQCPECLTGGWVIP